MRYKFCAVLVAILAVMGSTAGAATYTYKYTGAPLDRTSGEPWPELLGARYEFILSISEEKLRRSLKSTEISVFWLCDFNFSRRENLPCDVDGPIEAIKRMDVSLGDGYNNFDLRNAVAGAWLQLETGPSSKIIEGQVAFFDGPPDSWFGGEDGDAISYGANGRVYTQTQGEWRILSRKEDPLPIPVPASVFLLMTGLGVTWAAARKRQGGAG